MSIFGVFTLISGNDNAKLAAISGILIVGNCGNSGKFGNSILPKSTSGNLTVEGKSGTGGPILT